MHDQIRSSPSRPNPTSDGGLAEWTISKEQWDAYAEPMSKTMRSRTAVTVVAGTVVVSLCLGLPLTLVALRGEGSETRKKTNRVTTRACSGFAQGGVEA